MHSVASEHSSTSSTTLDTWQLVQLRTMKVGGNGSATDFFTRHGGSSLLSDSDVKKKYTSRVAELYKEELARRVKEDVAQCAQYCLFTLLLLTPLAQVPQRYRRRRRRYLQGPCTAQ